MIEHKGPFQALIFTHGTASAPVSLSAGTAQEAFTMARSKGNAFAVYDAEGALVRAGVTPPEPLSDDPDVTSIDLDPTGAFALTGHQDGTVRLWNIATGDPAWVSRALSGPVVGVQFVPGANLVLAWQEQGPLVSISRPLGDVLATLETPEGEGFSVCCEPDGLEVCLTLPWLARFGLPDLEPRPNPAGAGETAWAAYLQNRTLVGFVPTDETGEKHLLAQWALPEVKHRETHLTVEALAFACVSYDGSRVAVLHGLEKLSLTLYNVAEKEHFGPLSLELDRGDVRAFSFARNGGALFIYALGVGVLVLDQATGAQRAVIPEEGGNPFVVPRNEPIVPDDEEDPGIVVTRDAAGTLELTSLMEALPIGTQPLSCSADGRLFVAVPWRIDNNYVSVYDTRGHRSVLTVTHPANVMDACLSSDGAVLLTRSAGHAHLWRLPSVPLSLG